jgi:hypothetical protein
VVLRSAGPSQPARRSFVPKFYVASRIAPTMTVVLMRSRQHVLLAPISGDLITMP